MRKSSWHKRLYIKCCMDCVHLNLNRAMWWHRNQEVKRMNQHCHGSHNTPQCFLFLRSEDNRVKVDDLVWLCLLKVDDLVWEWEESTLRSRSKWHTFPKVTFNAIVCNCESPALKRLLFKNRVFYNIRIALGEKSNGIFPFYKARVLNPSATDQYQSEAC